MGISVDGDGNYLPRTKAFNNVFKVLFLINVQPHSLHGGV